MLGRLSLEPRHLTDRDAVAFDASATVTPEDYSNSMATSIDEDEMAHGWLPYTARYSNGSAVRAAVDPAALQYVMELERQAQGGGQVQQGEQQRNTPRHSLFRQVPDAHQRMTLPGAQQQQDQQQRQQQQQQRPYMVPSAAPTIDGAINSVGASSADTRASGGSMPTPAGASATHSSASTAATGRRDLATASATASATLPGGVAGILGDLVSQLQQVWLGNALPLCCW